MKNLNYLNDKRIDLFKNGFLGDEHNGAFRINYQGANYLVIAGVGNGWEHVSVSNNQRIPSWEVMCKIKELFFEDDETVVQFHPKKSEHVNIHPNCLHLWKKIDEEFILPPRELV